MVSASTPEDWIGRDFYAELGIDPTADVERITRAYRQVTAADRHAVAVNPNDRAAHARLAAAADAYVVLSRDRQRRAYDQSRAAVRFVVLHGRSHADRCLLLRMLGLLPTDRPLKSSQAVRVAERREQRRKQRQTGTKQQNRRDSYG